MNLQIHKASGADVDTRIDIEEVFAARHDENYRREVCETEARALFDCLKESLPTLTKQALFRLFNSVVFEDDF